MCNETSCYQSNKPALAVDPESRRLFLKGVASLPLACILGDIELARAAAHDGSTLRYGLTSPVTLRDTSQNPKIKCPNSALDPRVVGPQ